MINGAVNLNLVTHSIPSMQFNYQLTFDKADRKFYNHGFRINPDGIPQNYSTSLSHGIGFTHTLSPNVLST